MLQWDMVNVCLKQFNMKSDLIRQMLPQAIKLIREKSDDNLMIDRRYQSHINAMAASIRISGLKITLISYLRDDSNAKEFKLPIIQWISKLIEVEDIGQLQNLLQYYRKAEMDEKRLKEKIYHALITLKMAIRVFKFPKQEQND